MRSYEKEIQDKIKFLIEEKGAYKSNEILTFHLSPIPNWYSMVDGGEITCPVCEKHILKVKYPKPFNLHDTMIYEKAGNDER